MAQRTVRIRINFQRLESLYHICTDMTDEFAPRDEHGYLLREYLLELHHKLRKMLERKQERYTLNLVGTESIAFYQLWKRLDLQNDQYANVIVGSIMGKLSALAS